jgi:hypothetical protein
MKIKILIIVFFICGKVFSQEKLNVLVTVDEVVTGSYNLSDSYLIINRDTLKLKYEMGRFELANTEILKSVNSHTEIRLNFRHYTSCPEQKSYHYSIKIESSLLLQDYLLLKIYNFEMYPNVFMKNIGYGFEYISPLGSEALPKRKRIKRNKCQ